MILTPVIVASLLALGYEPMPAHVECPPGDIGGWYEVKVPKVEYVKYIAGREELRACGPGAIACARIGFQDGVPVGLITSAYPIDSYHYRPHLKQHELCHLLGWQHGPWWL